MAVFAGRQVIIRISTNGQLGASATWATIGQQRDGGINRGSETADATHKDDLGFPSSVITRTPWSCSCTGALNPVDSVWSYLETQWDAKAKVAVQVDRSAITGSKHEGLAIITALNETFPESDLVAYSLELQGDGQLSISP